jgi:hypothetical protein
MRIVDLRLVEDQNSALSLHPRLTVVTGLPTNARIWLARALADLLRGADCGLMARIEHGGETGELRPGGRGEPWLRRPVDLLVRADDIRAALEPATVPSRPARASAARAAAATSGRSSSDRTRPAHGDQTRAAHANAAATLDAFSQAVAAAEAAHAEALEAHRRAQADIDDARRDLDPYAGATLDAALRAAARLEVEVGAVPGTCRADTIVSVKDRMVLLEAQHRDILAALELLASADADAVADALDVVRVAAATGPIAPPEVLRLADEWAAISEHLAALEAKIASDEGGVESASDRLEAARAQLAQREAALEPSPVHAEEVRLLEAAHERVLAAERKSSSRLGGSRAMRALEEAMAEEQVILDRLGYPTWSAWIMGAPLLDATAEHARLLEQARRELDDAAWAWDRLTAKLESDPEFRSLLDRLERVLQASQAIVGDVEDVEHALRSLRVDPGPAPCSVAEARDALAAALVAAGFTFDGDVTLDELRLCAERWLAEIRTVAALRRQLEIDRDQCAIDLQRAQEEFERIEAIGPPDPGDGFGGARLTAARAAIESAEDRVNRHRSALTRVALLVAEAEGIGEIARQLGLAVEAKRELLDVTSSMLEASQRRAAAEAAAETTSDDAALDAGADDPDVDGTDDPGTAGTGRAAGGGAGWDAPTELDETVIDELDSRIAAARLAANGASVPVLLDDALVSLPSESVETILGWLETVAADTQIVYLGDNATVLAWADRRSPDRVGVVSGSGFFV